jgi:hypothetical protein
MFTCIRVYDISAYYSHFFQHKLRNIKGLSLFSCATSLFRTCSSFATSRVYRNAHIQDLFTHSSSNEPNRRGTAYDEEQSNNNNRKSNHPMRSPRCIPQATLPVPSRAARQALSLSTWRSSAVGIPSAATAIPPSVAITCAPAAIILATSTALRRWHVLIWCHRAR